ncbi:MAG: hypothetical protein AAFW64_02550 [Pseudomonadota bacterium]
MTSIVVGTVAVFGGGMAIVPAFGFAFLVGQVSFFLFIAKALACRSLRSRRQGKLPA